MKVHNKYISMFLIVIITLSTSLFFQPQNADANVDVIAKSAILVDVDTGKILYEKVPDVILPPASMSKMMAEYLVLEAIEDDTIQWDQLVPISSDINKISHQIEGSNVFLEQDGEYTVKDLYEAMAIESGNAATMALAQLVAGGSYDAFIEMMNDKAEELGLGIYGNDYLFVNSTGLPKGPLNENYGKGETGAENRLTARATAKLAYYLTRDYPEVLDTASIPIKDFQGEIRTDIDPNVCLEDHTCMKNWNNMLAGLPHEYEGMLGLKTGYTGEAGYCFTGIAKQGDRTLISVVMGSDTEDTRFVDTKRLLDYGFNHFEQKEIIPAGTQIEGNEFISVVAGKQKEVAISTVEPLITVVKKGEEIEYEPVLVLNEEVVNENGALVAPVDKEYSVGYVELTYSSEENHNNIDSKKSEQVFVVTETAVEKAGWFTRTMRSIGGFFSGIFSSVASTVNGWF